MSEPKTAADMRQMMDANRDKTEKELDRKMDVWKANLAATGSSDPRLIRDVLDVIYKAHPDIERVAESTKCDLCGNEDPDYIPDIRNGVATMMCRDCYMGVYPDG